jgi:hypothetical protein
MNKMFFHRLIHILLLITVTENTSAQYFFRHEGFIDRAFFFRPVSLSPNNLGVFEEIAPGFFNDPLQTAFFNPARLGENFATNNYFYVDVRSLPKTERNVYRFSSEQNSYDYRLLFTASPRYSHKVNSQVEEPRINAAWIFRPARREELVIGIMHRQIIIDDLYYDNFYREREFFGIRLSAISDIPDVELGRQQYDRFHQQGFYPSVMASIRLSDMVTTGIKFGISYYTGDGMLQNGRFKEETQSVGWHGHTGKDTFTDAAPMMLRREINTYIDRGISQRYLQGEAVSGVRIKISGIGVAGLTAGVLYGDSDQLLGIDHSFMLTDGERYTDDHWSRRKENLSVSQRWRRHGYHYYGSAEVQRWYGEANGNRIQFFYRTGRTSLNTEHRGSGNEYHYSDNPSFMTPDSHVIYRAENILYEGVNSTGMETGWEHRMGITSQIKLGRHSVLLLGFQFGKVSERRINYDDFEERSYNDWVLLHRNDTSPSYYLRTRHIYSISVENRSRVDAINIPALLRVNFSAKVSMETGVLLQAKYYKYKRLYESVLHLSIIEELDRTYSRPLSTYSSDWSEKDEESVGAVLLGIGYRITPGVMVRLSGVTETSTLDNNVGTVVPASLTIRRQQVTGNTRFMLGLEAGF